MKNYVVLGFSGNYHQNRTYCWALGSYPEEEMAKAFVKEIRKVLALLRRSSSFQALNEDTKSWLKLKTLDPAVKKDQVYYKLEYMYLECEMKTPLF